MGVLGLVTGDLGTLGVTPGILSVFSGGSLGFFMTGLRVGRGGGESNWMASSMVMVLRRPECDEDPLAVDEVGEVMRTLINVSGWLLMERKGAYGAERSI